MRLKYLKNAKRKRKMAEKRAPNQPPSFHQQKRGPGARDDQDDEIDSFLDMEEEDVAMQMPPAEDDMDVDLGEAGRNWVRPPVSESFDAATSPLSKHSRLQTK